MLRPLPRGFIRNQRRRNDFHNFMVNGDALRKLSDQPELLMTSFSWGVAVFSVCLFAAVIFVFIHAVQATVQNKPEVYWWSYILGGVLLALDLYCMIQCKYELIYLHRETKTLRVERQGLAWRKNYSTKVPMSDVLEIHLQETKKRRGGADGDFTEGQPKYKICFKLNSGEVLQLMESHNRRKAQEDMKSIHRFIQSCSERSQQQQQRRRRHQEQQQRQRQSQQRTSTTQRSQGDNSTDVTESTLEGPEDIAFSQEQWASPCSNPLSRNHAQTAQESGGSINETESMETCTNSTTVSV